MADSFQYGRVALAHVRTESLDQRTEYDPSGTDALWTKVTLTVVGIISAGSVTSSGSETAAETLRRIEHHLLTPRQYLRYQIGAKTVLEIGSQNFPDNAIDVNKGPLPQSVSASLITEGSIEVRFTISCCIVTCGGASAGAARRGFASNRWSQSESYDKTGYCTLSTNGLLIGRTDLRVSPDQLRGTIAPPIRQGYQRESSRYTLSEDGMRLSYEFVDREYYLPPPFIAYRDARGQLVSTQALEADGDLVVSSTKGGATYFGVATCTLKGPKAIYKEALLARAIAIANSMLQPFLLPDLNGKFIQDLKFSTRVYENSVSVQISSQLNGYTVKAALPGGSGQLGLFSQIPPGSTVDNQPGIAPTLRGNGQFLELLQATFQDPCLNQAIITADTGGVLTTVKPPNVPAPEIAGGGELVSGQFFDLNQFKSGGGGLQAAGGSPNTGGGAGGTQTTSTAARGTAPNQSGNPGTFQRINPASVGIGPIRPQTGTPTVDAAYDLWLCTLRYEYDTGGVVLPSTKSGENASYIRARNPSLHLVVDWSVQRTGKPPEIPDPCPDDNYKLVGMLHINTDELERGPTGALRYKISGSYRYGVLDMCKVPVVNALPPFIAREMGINPLAPGGINGGGVLVGGNFVDLNQFKQGGGGLGQHNLGAIANVPQPNNVNPKLVADLQAGAIGAGQPGQIINANGGNSRGEDVGPNGIYKLERASVWYVLRTIKPDKLFCGDYCS